MPAPLPYKVQVYAKLVALLTNRAQLIAQIPVGNWILQTTDGPARAVLQGAAPNDFPQLALSNGRFTHSMWTKPNPSYGMEQNMAGLEGLRLVTRRLEFSLVITGLDLRSNIIDVAEDEAQTALLLGGPHLSDGPGGDLSGFVSLVDKLNCVQRPANVQEEIRLQSTINIPVELEFTGSDLIAAANA